MKIVKKFEINTDDFKVYFDNTKKAHICENVETGEKTNLRCVGILMQMGVLKPLEFSKETVDISPLIERIDKLEEKINKLLGKKPIKEKPKEKKEEQEIKKYIMDNVLEKVDEEISTESDEEIDNWEEI